MSPPLGIAAHAEAPQAARRRLLDALEAALSPARLDGAVPAALWERALRGPLCEFARRPGKELRGRLTETAWVLAGGAGPVPAALPLIVEALHAGSLIVDDVQDDACERRGAPAVHVLHGVPLAINSGNWLYFWALAQLDELAVAPATRAVMSHVAIETLLACHQGQALDLTARVWELDRPRVAGVVAAITRGKTAALMGLGPRLAALTAGAGDAAPSLLGAGDAALSVLGALGEHLGTGLQMLDDLGGLGPARLAKGLEDLRGGRATWPWAWAAERLDHLGFARVQHRARAAAERGDDGELAAVAEQLRAEVDAVGRVRARAVLDAALDGTRRALGDSAALTALIGEVRHLEESYG